ncbi:uncharacterized protein LOC112155807 isoform X1 [Oryzias melastigma]|nr:uncharacterized protein LOC112155807 isoform X1 [Oryzias melastigma]
MPLFKKYFFNILLQVGLKDSIPVELAHHSCTCVAGSVLCNHCVALLFQSAHYSQLDIPVVPPVLSCTESEQQWHKPRTLGVKPGPVEKMAVMSAKPKQRTMLEGVKSTLYRAISGELLDLSTLSVSETYKEFTPVSAPTICTMGITCEVPLVDSALGLVQAGSPLSYQQPKARSSPFAHIDAPPRPDLPLAGYRLETSSSVFVFTEHQQLHFKSLEVTWEMANKIEYATRSQSTSADWHRLRKPRLTSSHFGEICHAKPCTLEKMADRLLKGVRQTAAMKRGLEMEADAIEEYCKLKRVNYYPCGFIIHPDTPWLGTSPDGVVFDPTENTEFGLVEIKCPNVKSYVDYPHLKIKDGNLELKQGHAYYWQVQGQLLLTGVEWCDFVVFAEEDTLIQRIYRDSDVMQKIRERADFFFFYTYLCKYLL